jgi:hypothetical protein
MTESTIEPAPIPTSTHLLEAATEYEVFRHADGRIYIDVTSVVEQAADEGLLAKTTDYKNNELWVPTLSGDATLAARQDAAPYALLTAREMAALILLALTVEADDKRSVLHTLRFAATVTPAGRIEVSVDAPQAWAMAASEMVEMVVGEYGRSDVDIRINHIGRWRSIWRDLFNRR